MRVEDITYKKRQDRGSTFIPQQLIDFLRKETGTVFNKGVINGQFAFASSSDFVKYKVWHSDTKTYDFTKDSILNVKSITGEKIKSLSMHRGDAYPEFQISMGYRYCGRGYKADNNYKRFMMLILPQKINTQC
ncbi:MAG: hypothetical protein ACLUIQ_03525 [Dialister invisus]